MLEIGDVDLSLLLGRELPPGHPQRVEEIPNFMIGLARRPVPLCRRDDFGEQVTLRSSLSHQAT